MCGLVSPIKMNRKEYLDMKYVENILWLVWTLILMCPITVLLYKLTYSVNYSLFQNFFPGEIMENF